MRHSVNPYSTRHIELTDVKRVGSVISWKLEQGSVPQFRYEIMCGDKELCNIVDCDARQFCIDTASIQEGIMLIVEDILGNVSAEVVKS